MYKFSSKQISLTDFNTPVGMKLNPDNRWVKKAELIPWDEIEQRYAKPDISVVNGFTRLEYHSFNAYNEALKLSDTIERYNERNESYPDRILADKIYRNRENPAYCAE